MINGMDAKSVDNSLVQGVDKPVDNTGGAIADVS